MSLGNVLNVAIGLIFTFLILGLIGTAVHEAAASLLSSRARLLRLGLQRLLNYVPGSADQLYERVFNHSLVQSLSPKGLPSYVPAGSFSSALFDSLSEAGQGTRFVQIERGIEALAPGPTRQSLTTFVVEAGGDLDVLRARVETWFNDAMDRLSGIYKRRGQALHMLFGLAIAIGFNVDSINIAQVLWQDADKRQAIALMAQNYATPHQSVAGVDVGSTAQMAQQLESLPIPMGWEGFKPPIHPMLWLYPILGWLVTGFAVSLGAPFWFDLLQQVMNVNVRGTGPKPDTA